VSSVANASKLNAASIFGVKVCRVVLYIYRFRLKKPRQGKMRIGVVSSSIGTLDWEIVKGNK
jgi:hypothetical protein